MPRREPAGGTAVRTKAERFGLRITAEQRRQLEEAAQLRGMSVSAFVLTSACEAAVATIKDYSVIELSQRDSLAFAQALISPPAPSERLRALLSQHDLGVAAAPECELPTRATT